MKAKKFEQQFDEGVDIIASLDLSKAKRVLQEQKRVNVDFPKWMIESIDREAGKIGVTRQSIIKVWLAERLEMSASNPSCQRTALRLPLNSNVGRQQMNNHIPHHYSFRHVTN